MTLTTLHTALALAELGLHVFPCRATSEVIGGVTYGPKSPYPADGFYSASTDPDTVKGLWRDHPDALVGVATGVSGLIVLDIDVKDGVDGYESIMEAWVAIPETFQYESTNGKGAHYVYTAPEGHFPPAHPYRKMKGVDRQSGGSYVVWAGGVPSSREEFAEAPQWLCDAGEVRSASAFEGTVRDWYESLEPGEPNILVRRAIARVNDDMGHGDMVKAQYEAIRLGAEGNPGVPELLERLEEAWLNRPGENHTTPESEWEYKFAEALASGIEEYGGTIQLRADLPDYHLDLIPNGAPAQLFTASEDKPTWTEMLRALLVLIPDDMDLLSVMWSAPATKHLSREWGLQFVMNRIAQGRTTPPPPEGNPILSERKVDNSRISLLTPEEKEFVRAHPTFIDLYLDAASQKGFLNPHYDIPAAWTLLSMAFGTRAIIPHGKPYGVNLWFLTLGESGTGKTSSYDLLRQSLDLMFKDGETFYNLGANSSPEGMHEALLNRDGKPSMILHDEASDFFSALTKKDWLSGLKDQLARWYEGIVDPSSKLRLKELKGKSAKTSFDINFMATPDRLLGLINTDMFETGFLARFNFGWADDPVDDDRKYKVTRRHVTDTGAPPEAYALVADLFFALKGLPPLVLMDWTQEAEDWLFEAHKQFDGIAKKRDHYEATGPAITRLKETMWKCAALLALWRGDRVINEVDAMTAIMYAEEWHNNIYRVVEAAGNGQFNQDCDKVEAHVLANPGITHAALTTRFRGMIDKSPRELEDRIQALVTQGRITSTHKDGKVRFYPNV